MSDVDDEYDDSSHSDFAMMANLQKQITHEKIQNPGMFVSNWEADEEDVSIETEDDRLNNPFKQLLFAAESGDEKRVRSLLHVSKELINFKDADGYSPLHRAAYEGHTTIMQLLLDSYADVDSLTEDGWTPLHSACCWSQVEAAEVLLRHCACINASTNGGLTPLHLAAKNAKTPEILQLLLMDPKIDHSLKNQLGETARDIAERSSPFYKLFQLADGCINKL